MSADQTLVRNWLKMLGALNIGAMTADEFEWRLSMLAPALAEEFPDYVFTPATARHVAGQSKYFPAYGEIVPLLQSWAKENPPDNALPSDRDSTHAENQACVRNWQRHANGDWGKTIPLNTQAALFRELDRWRRVRTPVFDQLVATDPRARAIAQRNNWIVPRRAAASPVKPEVRRSPPLDDPDA